MSQLSAALKAEPMLARLRAANQSLARRLEAAKLRNEEIVAAVYRAVRDMASTLEIPPVPAPTPDRRKRTGEVAIALVSDWQLGKRTPEYSAAVCARRVSTYVDKVCLLTDIQRTDHPVDELHVWMLGDMLEGEDIFPGQAFHLDTSLYQQVAATGPEIVVTMLRRFAAHFPRVHVYGVPGNHGRLGRRGAYSPESNADRMLYRICAMLLKDEPRIIWHIPEPHGETAWYAIDTIGAHRYLLFHGHQMRGGGFGGLPHYGFARAVNNWAAGVIPGGFTGAACGHWHQAASLAINERVMWINGSPESGNTWLQEELKVQCPPSQWLLFSSPKRGVTAEYRVWLT